MALFSKYLRRKEHIERDNIITNLYSLHESLLYSKGKLDSRRKLKQENLCFINKLNRVDHQCKNIGKLYSNNRCYKSHQWFWHANEANEAFCSSACSYKQKKHLPGGSTAITANWSLSLKWRCVQELHAIACNWMNVNEVSLTLIVAITFSNH